MRCNIVDVVLDRDCKAPKQTVAAVLKKGPHEVVMQILSQRAHAIVEKCFGVNQENTDAIRAFINTLAGKATDHVSMGATATAEGNHHLIVRAQEAVAFVFLDSSGTSRMRAPSSM